MADAEAQGALEQFLDIHFTTFESLELADDLLRDEERAHAQLVDDAAAASNAAAALSAEAARVAADVEAEARELIGVHRGIVGPENAAGLSDAGLELVRRLEAELQTYRRLSQAKAYVDAAADIERIAQQAAAGPQDALAACSSAVALLARHSGSPARHLVGRISQTAAEIWTGAERAAAEALVQSLQKMRWPGKVDVSSAQVLGEFEAGFSALAGLDRIARRAHGPLRQAGVDLRPGHGDDDAPLLPLEHMARAVDIRVRYHFEDARETSRADRPEWWLAHVLGMVRTLVPLLELHVQALYDGLGLPPLDVRNELIRLVLPTVERKLAHDRPEYLRSGLVVAAVARELAVFEQALRDVYFFDGPSALERLLADADVFAAWVEAERKHAIDSYMEAIAAPDAFDPLYEQGVVGPDDPSPTRIAQQVVALVEDAAERYAPVPSRMQRLQMLSTAQFPIVIALVEDIEAELDEFSRISLAFIRDAAGAGGEAAGAAGGQSSFMAQLGRLAAWYHTAWHVEEAAADWNNSELYVDLWAAACRHAAALGDGADPRDWRAGCDEWTERDRRVLDDAAQQPAPDAGNDEWLDGGIWERTIGTLAGLRRRILELMSRALNKDVVGQLRPYRKKTAWTPAAADIDVDIGVEVSAELAAALPGLAQTLTALARLVPPAAFASLLRSLAGDLDDFVVGRVACVHIFNAGGGRQLAADVGVLERTMLAAAKRAAGSGSRGPQRRLLPKAAECGRILACPLDGGSMPSDAGGEDEIALPLDDWAAAVLDPAVDAQEATLVLGKLGVARLPLKDVRRLVRQRADYGAAHNSPALA